MIQGVMVGEPGKMFLFLFFSFLMLSIRFYKYLH